MRSDIRDKEHLPIGTKIYLNNVLIRECVVVDTDEGYIDRWQTNENGEICLFYGVDGEPESRLVRKYGAVRVEMAS